jgi:hypothetical protein
MLGGEDEKQEFQGLQESRAGGVGGELKDVLGGAFCIGTKSSVSSILA